MKEVRFTLEPIPGKGEGGGKGKGGGRGGGGRGGDRHSSSGLIFLDDLAATGGGLPSRLCV
jgi:hypothetical protein